MFLPCSLYLHKVGLKIRSIDTTNLPISTCGRVELRATLPTKPGARNRCKYIYHHNKYAFVNLTILQEINSLIYSLVAKIPLLSYLSLSCKYIPSFKRVVGIF